MAEPWAVEPADEHNRRLLAATHPTGWKNPAPAERYDLVVLGAGTAGLVCAAGAAGLGARVALVERRLLGGDCLNFGCVPSKALLRASRAAADAREAAAFGCEAGEVRVDFAKVMERVRRLRADLAPHDSAERFRGLGVDVFLGPARFAGPGSAVVDGATLSFGRAVIATGARPTAPPIPGLKDAGYLTNETVFSLTRLPARLALVGAGPIGCELAQAFARLGSKVTLLEAAPRILLREDPDAAAIIERALARAGVELATSAKIAGARRTGGARTLALEGGRNVEADELLVGVGRAPNVEGLGLEEAGVRFDPTGVRVDEHLRTSNPRIFAAGDVCTPLKFTHLADAHARIVVENALFWPRKRASDLVVPWCTYTDPEVAHVGLYEAEAKERGVRVDTFVQELAGVDRARLDGETDGFVKVHLKAGSDRIMGATIVARHAGEMIGELCLAMTNGLGLSALGRTIHPYPTQAEAMRRVADAYNRTRLTPNVKGLIRRWIEFWR